MINEEECKKNELSEKEKRAMNVVVCVACVTALSLCALNLLTQRVDKIGNLYLYGKISISVIMFICTGIFIVLYLKTLRKIKQYFVRYTVATIVYVVCAIVLGFGFLEYLTDAINGSKTVTTTEYIANLNNQLFIIDDGDEITLKLPSEVATQLREKSLKSEVGLTDEYLINHSEAITVKYYPNSKILLQIDMNE